MEVSGRGENHGFRRITIARLDGDRSDRERRLIITHRNPRDAIRRAGRRVSRLPDSALRPTDVDRAASRVGWINRDRGGAARNLVIILRAVAARVAGQRHRA